MQPTTLETIARKAPNAAEFATRAVAANLGMQDSAIALAFAPTMCRMERIGQREACHKIIRLLRSARTGVGRLEQLLDAIAAMEASMLAHPVRL